MTVPRWGGKERGATIFAAVIFIALLAAALLIVELVSPNAAASPQSQSAASASATGGATLQGYTDPKLQQECTVAITQAQQQNVTATQKKISGSGSNVTDNCVGAVKTNAAADAGTKGYHCTGESSTVSIQQPASGPQQGETLINIKSKADMSVLPGECRVVACTTTALPGGYGNAVNSVLKYIGGGVGSAYCNTAPSISGISPSSMANLIGGQDGLYMGYKCDQNSSSCYWAPLTGENGNFVSGVDNSNPNLAVINSVFGADSSNVSGYIPANQDTTGTLGAPNPSDAQIQQIADGQGDLTQGQTGDNNGVGNDAFNTCLSGYKDASGNCITISGDQAGPASSDISNLTCPGAQGCPALPSGVSGMSCSGGSNTACLADPTTDQVNQLKSAGWSCALAQPTDDYQTCTPPQGPCPNGQPINSATGCSGSQVPPPGGGTPGPGSAIDQKSPSPNTFGGSGLSALTSLLSGLGKGLAQSGALAAQPQQAPAVACSTDPTTYAQQQQQYQQQLQQYNYQLQQYQYQQQLSSYYGSSAAPVPPVMPTACTPSSQSQCSLQPAQPAASSCSNGTWQPVYNGSCITSWNCSAGNAQISCQPQLADVGMTLAITYSCSAGTATGSGFTASGSSGSATTTVQAPPAGSNTATYGVTCNNNGVTSGAQCSVQVNPASIVFAANPATVPSGQTSQLGWVTAGMSSCVVSSSEDATFTSQNASNTSTNGTAQTDAIATSTDFTLSCQTLAGGTKQATLTVTAQ